MLLTRGALKMSHLSTPLGQLSVLSDAKQLYVVSFSGEAACLKMAARLDPKALEMLSQGETTISRQLKKELKAYFAGTLSTFTVPVSLIGTPFQQSVWRALQKIPYGETKSYAGLSRAIRKPTAFRAVANANGANPLVIVVPCHRVIYENGKLGGFSAGLDRKAWLLAHENSPFN